MSSETPARRIALECISDPLLSLDAEWRISYCNDAAATLLEGADDGSLEGRRIWEAWPGLEREAVPDDLRAARESGASTTVRLPRPAAESRRVRVYPGPDGLTLLVTPPSEPDETTPDGTTAAGEHVDGPTPDAVDTDGAAPDDGEGTATGGPDDVEAVFERISNGFLALDTDFHFTYANDRAADLIGYPPEEFVGERIWDIYPGAVGTRFQEEYERAMETQQAVAFEAYFEPRDTWYRVNAYPSETGLSVYFADVTEEKRHERELERRLDQQAAAASLGREALEGTSLDDLFDSAVETIADTLGADYCKVLELLPDEDELTLRAGVGWKPEYVGATVGTGLDSQAGYTLRSEAPVIVEDLTTETRFSGPQLLREHDVESGISVVIGPSDEPWGILGVHDTAPRSFAETDISFVRSVANVLAAAIGRQRYERRLKRYEAALERSTDVSAIIDEGGQVQYITPSVEEVFGYTPAEVVGESVFGYLAPGDVDEVAETLGSLLADPSLQPIMDARLTRKDGTEAVVEASARNLLDDPYIDGILVNAREVTERKRRERRLREQRDELEALVTLNQVVHEVNEVVVDASSRDELETRVCETLANSDVYAFAWIGEADTEAGEVVPRTSAGPHESYLESIAVPYGQDIETRGPAVTALETGQTAVKRDTERFSAEQWRAAAREAGFRSAAAIPLQYEGRQYGTLNVYSTRERAFDDRERDVISHVGESVAHAITALEHREALLTESVVELELAIPDLSVPVEADQDGPGRLRMDRTIRLDDGEHLLYAAAHGLTEDEVRAFFEQVPNVFSRLRHVEERGDVILYEILLDEPSVLSAIGEYGARLQDIAIEESGAAVTIELPAEHDTRSVVDTITDEYPRATLVSQQQVSRESRSSTEYVSEVESKLTDRQRQTLETAYGAGYYEWPRQSSASDVAEVLSIGDATVSQHLRAGHRKLCGALFEPEAVDREE